jgi:MFS transporter, NNP family, nitrate/nitrite transporter
VKQLAILASPALVAAVGQVPVGVLADRYGVRVVLPAVSAVSAVAAALFATVTSFHWMVVVAAMVGVAGTAFAAGASLVVRVSSPSSRGLRLSIFGAGGIAGGAITAACLPFLPDPASVRAYLYALAALLLTHSVVAAITIKNLPPTTARPGPATSGLRSAARREDVADKGPGPRERSERLIGERRVPLQAGQEVPAPRERRRASGSESERQHYSQRHHHYAITLLRLPSIQRLAALYSVAFAPQAATLLFLPAHMQSAHSESWRDAVLIAAVLVAVAAVARPVGGWLAGRTDPGRLLIWSLGTAGTLGVVLAFLPPLGLAVLVPLAGTGIALGLATGAILAVMATTVPVDRAGTVIGTVRGIGSLAGLLPLLLLAGVVGLDYSYGADVMMMATLLLFAAGYLHLRNMWVGGDLGLSPDGRSTLTTVVAVPASATASSTEALIAALTDLAARPDLIVVYGCGRPTPDGRTGLCPHAVIAALQAGARRRGVVTVMLDGTQRNLPVDVALLTDVLADGSVAVALVPVDDPLPTAKALLAHLGGGRGVRLQVDPVDSVVRMRGIAAARISR